MSRPAEGLEIFAVSLTTSFFLSAEKLEQAETDGPFNLGTEEGPPIRNLVGMIVDLSGEMCPENTPASSPAYNGDMRSFAHL